MKNQFDFTGQFSNDKKYYILDDIEDFKDPETDKYLVKVKVAGTNNLHTYILIKGFLVYFDIKLNELDDDISTSYLMFIMVRTHIKFKNSNEKVAFPLSEINKDHYLSMYWDLETVKKTQLCTMDHKMRKVSKGFKTDIVFMGVYALFWGSEVKLFHIIAIVLVNDEFPMKYENPNENLIDLIEVKTKADFLITMFQVYKNFSLDRESGWNTLEYD
ncbi:13481_t:CDS:2 [Dentiscutata heterogama]|uniref:13481_t:CDS:1 n=1 Tax=Dentiscutata heterogama TaxID=1316150 RepID=A0ACA9MN84_9GLOM|nr:13481_t:CDS:2 [Dentiscutata heterogama]